MRFEPEGMTSNPEIPFAKSMPDYIMRWLASRFLDADLQEELGILTPEVRARKAAQEAASSHLGDTAGPGRDAGRRHDGTDGQRRNGNGGNGGRQSVASRARPPTVSADRRAAGAPGVRKGLDLGPACQQCGGMMQRTGSCYTCSSCGFNTGCG